MKKNFQKRNRQNSPQSAPFADLAMIVLIFFVLVIEKPHEQGLSMGLRAIYSCGGGYDYQKRNILYVQINSQNIVFVNSNRIKFNKLKDFTKKFIINNGADPRYSENPQKAIIAFQTHRETNYETYIKVLNELYLVYEELRAESLNLSVEKFQKLVKDNEDDSLYWQAVEQIPRQISEADD